MTYFNIFLLILQKKRLILSREGPKSICIYNFTTFLCELQDGARIFLKNYATLDVWTVIYSTVQWYGHFDRFLK
jgi:hypothetical protein